MDDKTHNTLDALADLFLTEDHASGDALSGPAPIKLRPKAAQSPGKPVRPASFNEPPEPTLGELDELTQELLGMVEHEQAAADPSVNDAQSNESADPADPSASEYQQVADALEQAPTAGPALRLAGGGDGDHDHDAGGWDGRGNQPTVAVAEAVVLGNLPGMAGPWLTQYGQLLAQQDGAVAILHVDTDTIDLEVIEPTQRDAKGGSGGASGGMANAFSGPSLRVPPGGFAGRDLIAVLDQLCHSRGMPVRTVLLHMDPTPAALPRLLDLDYWTLLSGADDAAIVAGYRLLKQLLESDDRVARAHVGLMVVGSDKDAGQHAAAKLRSAVANFLHTPIELIGYQQKMIPARCRTLGTFAGLEALWPRLTEWLSKLETPEVDPAVAAEPEVPGVVSSIETIEQPAAKQPAAAATRSATWPPLDEPVRVDAQAEKAEKTADTADAAPRWELTAEPESNADDGQDAELDLFGLIDSDTRAAASIPGGLALEARCPSQPHTQLALDSMGRLHLLHRHDSAEGDPPTPKEAIVELVAVRDWARQHRQLLQLTERGRRFDPEADPVLHLFTDRADLSVNLVARLGELLKLHLLRDVAVGEERTFFCTPLSA